MSSLQNRQAQFWLNKIVGLDDPNEIDETVLRLGSITLPMKPFQLIFSSYNSTRAQSSVKSPKPRDLTVKLVQDPHRLLRLRRAALRLHPHISYGGVLTLDGLPQTLKLVFVAVLHNSPVRNLVHDGLECVLVCLAAAEDDLAMRRDVGLASVELVSIYALWEKSMAGRKGENL